MNGHQPDDSPVHFLQDLKRTLACQGQRCTFVFRQTQSPVQVIRGERQELVCRAEPVFLMSFLILLVSTGPQLQHTIASVFNPSPAGHPDNRMSTLPSENNPEDANNRSFWMPGNYQRTVKRTEDAFQACNDIVACFQERARVERQYAQQLSEWSNKWKPVVDSSPLYGSLLKAWQCFLSSADRLASLHASICRSLVSEDGDRVRTWQKDTFHKKLFGGFKESHDIETGFIRAQKPWAKRLKKVRARYEKVLEEVNRYAPRYMEEMESIFDQSQDEERKRIVFLKQAFLSIHKHLDITNNESVRAVYDELHNTLMAIDEHEDLRWWKNTHGPGMPTDWPHFQEWTPEKKTKKGKKVVEKKGTIDKTVMIGGVKVRALYDYVGQETDELSFKAGEEFLKIEDEDDQGWCRGMKDDGWEGLYPANYVEVV
ncbi:Protein kinase C and casein kinase substrate in neurons protein 3 [Nibea albiflora]|uniref:Protein kinase C and casein kinase substrate in neurons protein 3 n=1 Tax=Nibea albiflora TaxID=240163 RepID=A0ACB7EWX5_NIBAL|nr:Protein kinase C and casein kinase substrate in neurons protein 3 [Nibea albiflora]